MNGRHVVDNDLKWLGTCVVAHREDLGMTRRQLADNMGISYRVIGDIERGSRATGPGIYAMLEQALEWPPGTVAQILAGGQPPRPAADEIVGHIVGLVHPSRGGADQLTVWDYTAARGRARAELARARKFGDQWEIFELRRPR